ncbi:hypothetical protein AVEN_158381-1 [Araneus ventricosus]|uniref:MATH domain-containing protein n=1 Tax=Araneus ventricosus TaxID=182803 RepID=A0A4Y2KQW2_ARAVE|nr:hypothetical protein AVEN_158381-1 [Araneus ventricosus]
MTAEDRIDGVHELHADGHLIRYCERLHNFSGSLPVKFHKSFTFRCSVSPTSWSFRVTFEKVPKDGSVSCLVFIRRMDNAQFSVDVDFWMCVLFLPLTNLPPQSFKLKGMPRGGRETRTFPGVIPYEVLRDLSDQAPIFQVSFGVRHCHVDEDKKKPARLVTTQNRGPKAWCSKL